MEKTIQQAINGQEYSFIVATAMTTNDEAVHVNVRISPHQEELFRMVPNRSLILRQIATREAILVNTRAFLMLNPIDTGSEWQGQFEFRRL